MSPELSHSELAHALRSLPLGVTASDLHGSLTGYLCAGADAYVQTVLREDLVAQVPLQRFLDTIDYHSTPQQAGAVAQRGGVRTLVLTHQVPTPAPGTAGEWIALAKESFDGDVVFGDDLTVVTVG